MPSVMLRTNEKGELSFYIAKKDMEETVETLEYDSEEKWGGEITLMDGSKYYIEPMERPNIPTTLRMKRL